MTETRKIILVTKIDRAAIEADIAENGLAMIEPPDEECELEAISGDLLFWEAEVEVSDEEDDDEDED